MSSLAPHTTLRVLVVCEHESLCDRIDEILSGYAGNYQFHQISHAEQVLPRIDDILPHIVVIDDDLAPQSTETLIRQVTDHAPNLGIVALVDEQAITRARQVVLAGASAFVIKPLNDEEFWTTLRHVVDTRTARTMTELAQSGPAGQTIAFCGPKGGTGRTTMAVNTAISLHRASGQSVVLVDADFSSPALDVVLNLQDGRDISDLLSRMTDLDVDLMARVLTTHASGLQVLLAPAPGTLASGPSPAQIERIMALLQTQFDWVIVDLGLPLDDVAFAFLDMADRIVMSVLPEMVGLRNTRFMLDQFQHHGYAADKTWLILNRASIRGGVKQRDIEQHLRIHMQHSIPDDQPLASHSINRGVPLAISHPRSAVARSMTGLAKMLMQDHSEGAKAADAEQGASTSLFQRLGLRAQPANAQ